MPENNQMMSVEGQIVGMPLAGPESFSQQQLGYLKRALGVDETVLWENSNGQSGSNNITLSESISNFEYVQIEFANWSIERYIQILPVQSAGYQLSSVWIDNSGNYYHFAHEITITGTTYSLTKAAFHNFNSTSVTKGGTAISNFKTYKVTGIHRIAGGNT